jgi:hypothetical protein
VVGGYGEHKNCNEQQPATENAIGNMKLGKM